MIDNNPQSQIPVPTSQPLANHIKLSFLPIALALIIVALVSGGGVYLWQQNEIKKIQTGSRQPTGNFGNIETQTLQPTIKTNASPLPDLTNDWKNYTNQKFGFSLKYPTQWVEIVENANPWDVVGFSGSKSGQSDIFISIADNPKNLSLKDYYKNESETSDMVLPNPFDGSETYLTIDGKQAVKLGIPGAIANEEVAVSLDRRIFKIARHLDGNKEVEATFGNILNTIKFSTPSNISTGWLDYQNKRDGYSLKLPPNWKSDDTMAVQGSRYQETELYFSPNGQRGPVGEAFRVRYYSTANDYIGSETTLASFLGKSAEAGTVKPVTIGTLNGYSACFGAVGGCENQEIIQTKQGIYIFSSGGDLSEIDKQIISTFKLN